jgi:putative ABC transport system permease protein
MQRWLERAAQDIRYAVRTLKKSPGFTVAAAAILALGIGATTALYSLLDATLFRPLPYTDAARLVSVAERPPRSSRGTYVSPLNFSDWSDQNHSFTAMAATLGLSPSTLNEANGASETVLAQVVTSAFFDVLGIAPIHGRTFIEDDARQAVAGVVVSERLWQRRFAADLQLVGRSVSLGGQPVTVLGIVPGDFQFSSRADVWTLFQIRPDRRSRFLQVIARLKPGVPLAEAQADMTVVADHIARVAPATNADWSVVLQPLHEALVGPELRTTSLMLGGAVLCVLLLACANVANLLLSRGPARMREIAVRAALGGSHGRIVRQLLTESVVLSAVAGIAGAALSWAVIRALPSVIPPRSLPEWITLRFDSRLVVFAVALSAATSLLFGIVPAWQAGRVPLAETMNGSGRSATYGGGRLRAALASAEFALALVLMTAAVLLIRTLVSLDRVDAGYRARNVIAMSVSAPIRYAPERIRAIWEAIQRDVVAIPGVRVASITTDVPLAGFSMGQLFEVVGRDSPPESQRLPAHYQIVGPHYFDVLAIPVRLGRAFTDRDTSSATPVCIINEQFAKRYFDGGDPIGARISVRAVVGGVNNPVIREIVGVIGQVKTRPDAPPNELEIYVPYAQNPWGFATLVVQTVSAPVSIVPVVTAAIGRIDKAVSVTRVRTMDEVEAESTARPRFRAQLVGAFAGAAVVLAAIGIFSVLMFNVHLRRREFSIRLALGATGGDIMRVVVVEGAYLGAIGLATGLGAATLLSRSLRSLLFGVEPLDLTSYGCATAFLAGIALVASAAPALRASRSDPAVALRDS